MPLMAHAGAEFVIKVIKAFSSERASSSSSYAYLDIDKEGGTAVKEIGKELDYLSMNVYIGVNEF
jgi:malate dehydrogenase